MNRAAYFLSLLDFRDRLVLVGALLAALIISAGAGYVHGAHEQRAARQKECLEQVHAMARRARVQVVALADPCLAARR